MNIKSISLLMFTTFFFNCGSIEKSLLKNNIQRIREIKND